MIFLAAAAAERLRTGGLSVGVCVVRRLMGFPGAAGARPMHAERRSCWNPFWNRLRCAAPGRWVWAFCGAVMAACRMGACTKRWWMQ